MNPSSKETSGLNLPPPVEQASQSPESRYSGPQPAEQAAPAAEKAVGVAQPAAPMPLPTMPMPNPAQSQQSVQHDDVKSTSKSKLSGALDDPDLIEKEWVDKAKRIVEQNRDDPYKQSEELTGVKAEYMKQRYDKTIKLNK